MFFPVGSKRNHRYRGPVESRKVSDSQIELSRNIATLTAAFNTHAQGLIDLQTKLNDTARVTLGQDITKMLTLIDDVKKGE